MERPPQKKEAKVQDSKWNNEWKMYSLSSHGKRRMNARRFSLKFQFNGWCSRNINLLSWINLFFFPSFFSLRKNTFNIFGISREWVLKNRVYIVQYIQRSLFSSWIFPLYRLQILKNKGETFNSPKKKREKRKNTKR